MEKLEWLIAYISEFEFITNHIDWCLCHRFLFFKYKSI